MIALLLIWQEIIYIVCKIRHAESDESTLLLSGPAIIHIADGASTTHIRET